MDQGKLINALKENGCYDDKKRTRAGLFAEVTWNNFNTDQVNNRLNAGWKTAQYVVVNDCEEKSIPALLSRWRLLTGEFSDQYLLIYKQSIAGYAIFDSNGRHIGDDSILEELINRNRIREFEQEKKPLQATSSIKYGDNILLYGVPGCGKSYYIKKNYCDDVDYMERVVFHPDYTYSDFIGQILPQNKEGHISYPFIPGPLTRILRKAVEDENHNYFLIIEELNRGNAPAIFGEVFQLLDRIDGVSEYGITNTDIASEVYDDPTHIIKFPKNLFIIATMNTADQNVFTLDTAFKRRWKMKSIPNEMSKCGFANNTICDSSLTWAEFVEKINDIIVSFSKDNIESEDKRLGAFFLQQRELSDIDLFSEKILMYLWNDAFKYHREEVFSKEYMTLDELIKGFKTIQFKVFLPQIGFSDRDNESNK